MLLTLVLPQEIFATLELGRVFASIFSAQSTHCRSDDKPHSMLYVSVLLWILNFGNEVLVLVIHIHVKLSCPVKVSGGRSGAFAVWGMPPPRDC